MKDFKKKFPVNPHEGVDTVWVAAPAEPGIPAEPVEVVAEIVEEIPVAPVHVPEPPQKFNLEEIAAKYIKAYKPYQYPALEAFAKSRGFSIFATEQELKNVLLAYGFKI